MRETFSNSVSLLDQTEINEWWALYWVYYLLHIPFCSLKTLVLYNRPGCTSPCVDPVCPRWGPHIVTVLLYGWMVQTNVTPSLPLSSVVPRGAGLRAGLGVMRKSAGDFPNSPPGRRTLLKRHTTPTHPPPLKGNAPEPRAMPLVARWATTWACNHKVTRSNPIGVT